MTMAASRATDAHEPESSDVENTVENLEAAPAAGTGRGAEKRQLRKEERTAGRGLRERSG